MTITLSHRRDFSLKTWEQLVTDQRQLELLLTVGQAHAQEFDEVSNHLWLLQRYRNFSYLIDFDVIEDLISVDVPVSEQADTFDIERIRRRRFDAFTWFDFAQTKRQCWVPWGAFQELLTFFRQYTSMQNRIRIRKRMDMAHIEALQNLAKVLGIGDPASYTLDGLNDEIVQRLRDSELRLSRLNQFLSTFSGVRAQAHDRIAELVEEWLSACPRRDKQNSDVLVYRRQNDPRDKFDALNIAIAVQTAMEHLNSDERPQSRPAVQLLVTTTRIVLDLVNPQSLLLDTTPHIPDERKPRFSGARRRQILNELKEIMYEQGGELAFSSLPIIHPRQALAAEWLGFFERSELARNELIERHRELRTVVDFCRSNLANLYENEKDSKLSIGHNQEIARRGAIELIENFGRFFSGSSEFEFDRLEDRRSIEVGLGRQVIRHEDQHVSIGSVKDSLETLTSEFLFAVTSLREKTAKHLTYLADISSFGRDGTCLGFTVHELTAGKQNALILEGEAYPSEGQNDRIYSLRIHTYAFLKEFLEVTHQSLLSRFEAFSFSELKLASDDDECWKDGLLLFCGEEWIGVPFARIMADSSDKRPCTLTELVERGIERARVPRFLKGVEVHVPPDPLQIRIATPEVDVSFDCSLLDDEKSRCIRWLAFELSIDLLVHYASHFLPRFVDESKLSDCLNELFSRINGKLQTLEQGILAFDNDASGFQSLARFPKTSI